MNISKLTEDDGISMYLSFENTMNSDSTSSRSAYKTIACEDESNSLSDLIDTEDSRGNTTLHNTQKQDELSSIMKDCISVPSSIITKPLIFPHVLKEFNAMSSTPSKNESPVKSTSISSDKELYGKSYKALEQRQADLSAHFNNLVLEYERENKENPQPSSNEDSMPSFSNTSIIQLQRINNNSAPIDQGLTRRKVGIGATLKSIQEHTEPPAANLKVTNKQVKMNSAVRKTLCEPDLQMNRPSRIVTAKKTRFSMAIEQNIGDAGIRHASAAPHRKASGADIGHTLRMPVPKNIKTDKLRKVNDEEANSKTAATMRKALSSKQSVKANGAGRKSMAVILHNEKRPTPKRMPPIVKTTLNFATRKSVGPIVSSGNTAVAKRRSVLLLQAKLLQSPLNKHKKSSSSTNSSNDKLAANVKNTDLTERNLPAKRNLNMRKTLHSENPDSKFVCAECGAVYRLKSLLEAHKKTHRTESPDSLKKLQRAAGGGAANNGTAANNTTNHQCKYCDKGFVLERALHIHLMQHCPKIPAAERRKLNFTEMDHVKKEETPHFRVPPIRTVYKPLTAQAPKDALSNLPVRKTIDVSKIQNVAKSTAGDDKKDYDDVKLNLQTIPPSGQAANRQTQMAPPQSTKVKKRTAHTGVFRTPNKDIPCVPCKQSFKSVLDYTNHMMATHATLDASINSLSGHVE